MLTRYAGPFAVAVFYVFLFAGTAQAESRTIGSFLPPNSRRIPIGSEQAKGITEAQFNQVMDRIQAIYGPIVASKGGVLVIRRLWDDPTVNASAERDGNKYILNMYGGLARDASITQDGMALVACHEMGHHLGGAPKISGDWATNEGGADYFANLKCLRRMFTDASALSFTRMAGENQIAKQACDKSFKKASDRAVCVRGVMAGLSVTALLADGDPKLPQLETPDPSTVDQTNDEHPAAQCRLDTYFQASLCPVPYSVEQSDSDPRTGACTRSGGFSVGLRPRCWYKPPAGEGLEDEVSAAAAPSAALETLRSPGPLLGL